MSKIFLTTIFLLLSFFSTIAQGPDFEWVKDIKDSRGFSLATDESENIYVTGIFSGTIDFDPGGDTFNLTAQGNYPDIYILKLNPSGNLIWVKQIGGPFNDRSNFIKIDESGDVYVTGAFRDSACFNSGNDTFNLVSAGGEDAFLLKLDSSGNLLWMKQFGGHDFDSGSSITIDESNDVYVMGSFRGTGDFNPGVDSFNLITAGNTDVFIVKLSSIGGFIWARSFGGIDHDFGSSMAIGNLNNIVVSGNFRDTINFDVGTDTLFLSSNGNSDAFILKLDIEGNFMWAKQIGGLLLDRSISTCIDFENNICLSGAFQGTVDVDPGPDVLNYTSKGESDIFILKLDGLGDLIWAKNVGSKYIDNASSLFVDKKNSIYITGDFRDSLYLSPCSGMCSIVAFGKRDIFILKLSPYGSLIWANQIGGTESNYGRSISVDQLNNIYITGSFRGVTDFNPTQDSFYLPSANPDFFDMYVLKLSQCNFPIDTSLSVMGSTLLATIPDVVYQWINCDSNTLISGATNQSYTATAKGNYAVIITQDGCCDTSECYSITNVSIMENELASRITVYPNPTKHGIRIDLGQTYSGIATTIKNIIGQTIARQNHGSADLIHVNLAGPAGLYFVEIREGGGRAAAVKVLKE